MDFPPFPLLLLQVHFSRMPFTGASALKVSSPTLGVAQSLLCVRLFCDPMDCSPQAPLSLGFPRQEYWRGLPFPTPGDLPYPGIDPTSLASPALAGRFFITAPPRKPTGLTGGGGLQFPQKGCVLSPLQVLLIRTHGTSRVLVW